MPETNEQAALDAVSNFFGAEGREDIANAEAPLSEAPVYTKSQQEADELVQDGVLDIDGNAIEDSTEQADKAQDAAPAQPKQTAAPATPEKVTVDDDLKAIAKEFGWTDEKIGKLIAADPELARDTFASLAVSLAEQSRQYLPQAPAAQAAAQQQIQAAPPALPDELSDKALAKFAEENGEQAANLMRSIRDNFLSKQIALEERLNKAEQNTQAQELRAVAQEANSAINDLAGKHAAFYGSDANPDKMTVVQYQRRVELAQKADLIRSAAHQRGQNMTVKDALTHAHRIMAYGNVKNEARQEVVAAVQKRSRQVTARPTARSNPSTPSVRGEKTEQGAMDAYSRRLAELNLDE